MLAIVFDAHAFQNDQTVTDTGSNPRRRIKMNRIVACPRQPKNRPPAVVACGRRSVVASGNPGILPNLSPRSALVAKTQGHWKIRTRNHAGKNRDGPIDGGLEWVPGTFSEHTIDNPYGQQGPKPEESSCWVEAPRTCSACTDDSSPIFSPARHRKVSGRAFDDSDGLALFLPDLRGGSHDFLHIHRVRSCASEQLRCTRAAG